MLIEQMDLWKTHHREEVHAGVDLDAVVLMLV
jgi:hypothetical protein